MKTKEIELSETQRLGVETVGKNVCVSAGAGSGKTRVLVERFLHLVMQHRISPQSILAITFTEKAANEMKRRIVERLREENLEEARREVENAAIGTIHSFSARLLREHPLEAGVDPRFTILESHEAEILQEQVLDEIIEAGAAEEAIFNLLQIYGEKGVREGILGTYRASRNSEEPYEVLLKRRTSVTRSQLESRVREGLQEIGEGAASFDDIESLSALRGKLRASGKQKETIREVREDLSDLISLLWEERSLPAREVFVSLALRFETAYEEAKREERALDFDDLQLKAIRLLSSGASTSQILQKIYQEKFREILVDEFQDTNPLQGRLIELIRRENNQFIVGDFKQSIYGFRGTQVEVFLEKEKAFGSSPAGIRLPLVDNYRSRPKVIDFVNRFFEAVWKEDPIPFERLQAVREEEGEGPRVERLALRQDDEENLDDLRIREARTLAQRIRSLVENEGHACRDIALLFEAMTHVHFYEQELRREGIPHYVISTRGFYHQPEVRDVISFLGVLENPKRDVPLAAALRSPLFQISDDTLFWLARRAKKELGNRPLAEAVLDFELIPEITEAQKGKLRFFKETLEQFLGEKEKLGVSSLIEKIYRVTAADLYVLKLRQGERRFANLRKLVELAREWESGAGACGWLPLHLGDFVRAVKRLETRDIRESQAQVEAEEGNVVRLLTIHSAKGLEFPVVILPDLGRGEKPVGRRFLLSEGEGLGLQVPNESGTGFEGTLTFRRAQKRMDQLRSEESKRLLYVAMTRAKEKLILSGTQPKPSRAVSFHDLPTWAHWVDRVLSEGEWEVKNLTEAPPDPFPFERKKVLAERKAIRSRLENLEPIPMREEPAGVNLILDRLSFPKRAYFRRIDLPVSAFLLFARDRESYFRRYEMGAPSEGGGMPLLEVKDEEEGDEEGLTSAQFGTRVHQILEQILLRRFGIRQLDPMVLRFTQDLGEKQRREILEMVRRFMGGSEAREILEASSFYPELPFVLRLPYGLVQGVMDLIYQKRNGDWVILDYKTSQATEETVSRQAEDYRLQLELYALACWKILGKAPREARVHFLRPGLTHSFPFKPEELGPLHEKFAALEEEILEFRKGLTEISPDRS